jgi:hypothetical protein
MPNENKVWRYLFVGLLVLSGLYQLQFGVQILFAPAAFYELSAIPVNDMADFTIINRIIGLGQLFLLSMAALSIYGTQIRNRLGVYLGMILGIYFVAVGIAVLGEAEPAIAIFDLVRGVLTIGCGYMTYREFNKHSLTRQP